MSTESGVLSKTQYSFQTRFHKGTGTNPDELIVASLSGCFSMALVNELGLSGFFPERIDTAGTAMMEDLPGGWTMTSVHLEVHADIPDIDEADFLAAAMAAKMNCPISRLLNTRITMNANLN